MNRFDDRMLERDLEEELGGEAPSDLRERILAAVAQPRRRRTSRVRALALPAGRKSNSAAIWGVAVVTLSLAAAFVVLWSYVVTRPTAPAQGVAGGNAPDAPVNQEAPTPQPQPKSDPERSEPRDEAPKPAAEEQVPAPHPQPPSETPKPPDKPSETAKPDEVEKPPTPPGEGPDGTAPRETPKEAPQPVRTKLGTVLSVTKGAKLQARLADAEPWRAIADEPLLAGMQLKIAHPADLRIGDALVRFEGTLRLDAAEGAVRVELLERKTQAWCDNLGGRTPLLIGLRGLSASMKDGVAHFEAGSASIEIACIEGLVLSGETRLVAGQFSTLSARGFAKPRELTASERQPRLVNGMAPRSLMREEFTQEPAGKLYGGALKNGAAAAEGAGSMVAFDINPLLIAVKGAKLRMRYRVSACTTIYLQFLGEDVSRQFGNEFTQRKQGQWLELEIRLDSLPFDAAGPGGEKIPNGLKLGKFQCYVRGEKNCTLEIDWIEVVRE